MAPWFQVDWGRAGLPQTPVLELVVRESVIDLALFLLLRLLLKRQSGPLGLTDLLVVVLMADAAQNGRAHAYRSITEGLVLVATIIGWRYALDWLGDWFPGTSDGGGADEPATGTGPPRADGGHAGLYGGRWSQQCDRRQDPPPWGPEATRAIGGTRFYARQALTTGEPAWEITGHRTPWRGDGRQPLRNGQGIHDAFHKASGVSARRRDESVRTQEPLGRPAHRG
jgi:hypothetical protein